MGKINMIKKNKLNLGQGMDSGLSSNLDSSGCVRCGKLYKGPYRVKTTACYRCGQKGHMACKCPN